METINVVKIMRKIFLKFLSSYTKIVRESQLFSIKSRHINISSIQQRLNKNTATFHSLKQLKTGNTYADVATIAWFCRMGIGPWLLIQAR